MDFAYQWPRYSELVRDSFKSRNLAFFPCSSFFLASLKGFFFNQIIMKTLINSCGTMAL